MRLSFIFISAISVLCTLLVLRLESQTTQQQNVSMDAHAISVEHATPHSLVGVWHAKTIPGIQIPTTASLMSTKKHENVKYWPIKDILYNANGSNSDDAVFVVPRRVYYDNRLLAAGKRQNAIIVLTEAHDDAVNTIVACELNGHYSTSISMLKESTWWVRKYHPKCTHLALVIQCRGLPQDAIFNGSVTKLIYRKKGDDFYSSIESEKPLFLQDFGSNPSIPTKGKGSIVVCSGMFGHPNHFDQWVMYHNYLGVEGIHLNNQAGFSENASYIYPYYSKSLDNGFTRTDTWSDVLGSRSFYYSQKLKYLDCLYRHIGVFEYGLFYDYDDFFNPVVPHQNNLHYYFSKFFSQSTSSVCMPWRQMECRPIERLVKDVQHGNLTNILSGYKSTVRSVKKCAHRLNAILFIEIHEPTKLLSGRVSYLASNNLAYVAHNRYDAKLCGDGS